MNSDIVVKAMAMATTMIMIVTVIFTNGFHVAERIMYSLHRGTVEKHKVRMSPC